MTEQSYDDALTELVDAWTVRSERVNAAIGDLIPATLVPATVVDFR